MQSLLSHFRAATKASHELLDSAFGSLNLFDRADYVRFLSGHYLGMVSIFDPFRQFVVSTLGFECPDYPAMLRADLASLNVDAAGLPSVATCSPVSPEAAGYVVSGSRLGLAMLAREGYWGRVHGSPSAYMDDVQGLAIWKHAAAALKDEYAEEPRVEHQRKAAVAVFDTFRAAFAASAPAQAR